MPATREITIKKKCGGFSKCEWQWRTEKCVSKGKDSGMKETAAAYLINMYDEVKEDW